MTGSDPREAAERIRAETGIDLCDTDADAVAAKASMRRAYRQVAGTVGAGVLGAIGLVLVVLAATSDTTSAGGRIASGIAGVIFLAAAALVAVWAWRLPAVYRDLVLPRRAAHARLLAEIGGEGLPTDWLTRRAMVAYSTPSEVRQMREEQGAAGQRAAERRAAEGRNDITPGDAPTPWTLRSDRWPRK